MAIYGHTKPRTIGMRKITQVVAAAAVPEAISATPLFVTDFEVFAPSANTGASFYIGDSTVNNTWIPRPKGIPVNFVHGTGNFIGVAPVVGFDLSKIFVAVAADGDSVIVQYYAGDKG